MARREQSRRSRSRRKQASRNSTKAPKTPRLKRAPRSSKQTMAGSVPAGKQATVLIIDDEEVVRSFLREALRGAGIATVEARNGLEGLERYKSTPTDMVITDLVMPEAGGQEVIMELTWEAPPAKILAITGESGDPTFLSVAKKFGACRTMQKPFKRDELLRVVSEILREQRRHVRLAVDFPISFEGDGSKGEGKVINISRGGCAVESAAPVRSGQYFSAVLQPPSQQVPLLVDLAVVRWSTGAAFGLEFIRMEDSAKTGLRRYLESLLFHVE